MAHNQVLVAKNEQLLKESEAKSRVFGTFMSEKVTDLRMSSAATIAALKAEVEAGNNKTRALQLTHKTELSCVQKQVGFERHAWHTFSNKYMVYVSLIMFRFDPREAVGILKRLEVMM